jgi:simple sugar transport system permease protein
MKERSLTLQILLTLIPIILSLSITALLIMAVNADPRAVFEKVWEGAFRDSRSFSQVVNFWIPLTLVSMGLIVTFTAGLWNIGVEGQMMMGAVAASWAALYVPLPAMIAIPFEIVIAMLGGALWASVVAVLKTRLGVHEIFGGVGLNALANVAAIYLISGPWQPAQGGSVHATEQFSENAVLPPMSADFQVSFLALLIVAGSMIAVVLALRGTRWGLQLKATGKNARSALLLGVPMWGAGRSCRVVSCPVHLWQPPSPGIWRHRLSGAAGGAARCQPCVVGSLRHLWLCRDSGRQHSFEGGASA